VVTLGVRGPIPKRTEERRRRNKEGGEVDKVISKMPEKFVPRPAAKNWHTLSKEWYESLIVSGQSDFYEPSDWAQARILAEMLDRLLRGQMNGQALAAWLSGAADLMTTEGQRRRLRMEIQKRGIDEERPAAKILKLYRDRVA